MIYYLILLLLLLLLYYYFALSHVRYEQTIDGITTFVFEIHDAHFDYCIIFSFRCRVHFGGVPFQTKSHGFFRFVQSP
jgi:hypothetical protein